ncbi:MAG: hypothetical protein ABFS86_16970 [Planctomycetota bacterium]
MRSRTALLATVLVLAAFAAVAVSPAWALGAPSAQGVFPASGTPGTTVPAVVTGTGLSGATASILGEPGVAVTVQTTTDTEVNLQLVIDAAAVPGERILSLSTSYGTVSMSFVVNPAGGPIVTGVSPTPIATQGFSFDVSIAGENLSALDENDLTISGNGVTVTSATAEPDGSALHVSLDVAADADLGTHAIIIDSETGGAVLQIYVRRPEPVITAVSPGAGEVGAVVPLTITGSNLTGAALVITSGTAGGVAISDVATPDDSTLTATLTIDGALAPESEPRILIVTTESGQDTADFFVVAPGVPSLTGIRPGAGEPGETVGVTLHGLNLTGATVATTSGDITLSSVVVVDDESITLDVAVAGGAATGTDHSIDITVGADTVSATFRVIGAGEPYIGAVRPPFGNRGAMIAVILEGVNLGSVVEGTGVSLAGPKIIESNAEALDDSTVRAILEIDPEASIGARDVTVTTAVGSATINAAFRVNIPGQVPTITGVTPTVAEPGTSATFTVTGSGFLGAGVSVGGPGATVSNISVDVTGSTVTFDLAIAADAPAESRPLIVVTEFGIAVSSALSLPAQIQLEASWLAKTGSVFEVTAVGYRLFVFEFSMNERFDAGVRTYTVSETHGTLTLSRLDAENIRRAVRDLPFGYVRVTAVTATSQLAKSAVIRFRR